MMMMNDDDDNDDDDDDANYILSVLTALCMVLLINIYSIYHFSILLS
jgi:hypothetical protein